MGYQTTSSLSFFLVRIESDTRETRKWPRMRLKAPRFSRLLDASARAQSLALWGCHVSQKRNDRKPRI